MKAQLSEFRSAILEPPFFIYKFDTECIICHTEIIGMIYFENFIFQKHSLLTNFMPNILQFEGDLLFKIFKLLLKEFLKFYIIF